MFSFVINNGPFAYMVSTITSIISLFLTHITRDWLIRAALREVPPNSVGPYKEIAEFVLNCYPLIYFYKILTRLLNSKLKFNVDGGKFS